MSSFFVINAGGAFYSHKAGCLIEWANIGKANEFQTVQSARYISDKYPGTRVVEAKGKRILEVI